MSSVIEAALSEAGAIKVLDFGCGTGSFVRRLRSLGYDAHGCDIGVDWQDPDSDWSRGLPAEAWESSAHLHAIDATPYRLPFPDHTFDAVVSITVMEHVQNKAEAFAEIARVLKPEGQAIHLFPSKWYLLGEPHMHVPLVSWFWPKVPRWWLALWAMAGIRNEFQKGMTWRQVVAMNADYCSLGLAYFSRSQYERLAPGKIHWASRFNVRHAPGGLGRLFRSLPIPPSLAGFFRDELLVHRPI